jgi:GntR family transcriptional regulator
MPRPYQRVAADLRDRITSGEWPPGHRIPSWRNLAAEHDVGQGTIRLAIAELRAAGLVE